MDLDARTSLHRILLNGSPRAESPRRHTHAQGIHTDDHTVSLSTHLMGVHGTRHGSVRITPLLADHRTPTIHRAPVFKGRLHINVVHASKIKHVTRQFAGQLNDVRGTTAGQDFDRLLDLERVADLAPQGNGHIGEQGARGHTRVASQVHQSARQLTRTVNVLHECSRPDLDIQDESARPFSDLLTHDGTRNQRNGLNG